MPSSDATRFPALSPAGQALLQRLREHPYAPRYTAVCGHRLTPAYLERVRAFERELQATPPGWPAGGYPAWLDDFVTLCFETVPAYRRYGERPARFEDIPLSDRADLSREIWAFVPDGQPLDDLILYATSGTTGHPLTILSHPVASGMYTPLVKAALERAGVTLASRAGDVACVLVGLQQNAYTYPSVTPQQDEAGHLKLNLHPADWRDPADRARFLDDLRPEIYTGDPVAFAELLTLPLRTRPKALVSTALALTAGLRAQLEAHFQCPVVDVYAMNECGPIAARADAGPFALLHHRLYVEIVDEAGAVCPPGVRGEVVLTGGFNPYLPLLRYRTNDYAALGFENGRPVLSDLSGRPAVVFQARDGRRLSALDVTAALKDCAWPQYALHQTAAGALHLRIAAPPGAEAQARAALAALFGPDQPVTVEFLDRLTAGGGKLLQYTSDQPAAGGAAPGF